MSDHERDHLPTPGAEPPVDSAVRQHDGTVPSRRRFVKAGLTAVPLVLTLRARPALGQSDDGSGNLSGASDNLDQQEDVQNQVLRAQLGEEDSWYNDPLEDDGWGEDPLDQDPLGEDPLASGEGE